MPVLLRDYECRSLVDLKAVGAFKYAMDPSTQVLCCGFAIDDEPVRLWLPGEPVPVEFFEAASNPDWVVLAFSDTFETAIEKYSLAPSHSWPLVPLERHRCIQAQALAHALPASLEGAAQALNLPHAKDVKGRRVMLQMAKPRRPRKGENPQNIYWFDDDERRAKLYDYCRQDVKVERELARRLRPLCAREQQIWRLDAIINQRGVAVDRQLAKAAQGIVSTALGELDREIAALTGGDVTKASQVARIITWAQARGCKIPSLAKDELEVVLTTNLPPQVRRVLELRLESAQAATKKLAALLSWAGNDGRIRGCFKYHGANPGRWTGSGPQLQNLKKLNRVDDVRAAIASIATGDYAWVRARSPNPLALIGSCIRPMLIAAEGCRLIGADFSAIEARVLAWLAGETWKLAAFRAGDTGGPSVYAITAGRIYGRDPQTIAKESPEREVGKRCELAFGYAGGLGAWRAFEKYGTDTRYLDAQVEGFKYEWRALHPHIVAFWHALNAAAIEAVWMSGKVVPCGRVAFRRKGAYLFLRLPSSRKIAYPFPKLLHNGHFGEHAVSFKDASAGQWRDYRNGHGAYGGLFAENVTQAVARDLLAEALIRLERAGYPIVLHCHDEAVAEVLDGFGSIEEFQQIMTALPVWAAGLPIAAEGWTSDRYTK